MNRIYGILLLTILCSIYACQLSNYEQNETGFTKLNADLKEKFGAEAYYTAISMSQAGQEKEGYLIIVDKSDKKESTRQERWMKIGDSWEQSDIANMQVDKRGPGFYKFQLDKEVNLSLLGTLVDTSKQSFQEKIKDKESVLQLAIVNTNSTVQSQKDKYRYTVILREKDSEVTHSYTYGSDGKLIMSN